MATSVAMLLLAPNALAFSAPASLRQPATVRASGPAMQFSFGGGGKKEATLPKGWKKVKSRSRPGEFSYENTKTGQVYSELPPSLFRRSGGEFFDDEKDTVSKKAWRYDPGEDKKKKDEGGFFGKLRETYADKTSGSELEKYYKNGKKTDGYVEDSGFAANGEDLATVGGIYYLATVPFLIFFLLYVFGARGQPPPPAHPPWTYFHLPSHVPRAWSPKLAGNVGSPYDGGGNFK